MNLARENALLSLIADLYAQAQVNATDLAEAREKLAEYEARDQEAKFQKERRTDAGGG